MDDEKKVTPKTIDEMENYACFSPENTNLILKKVRIPTQAKAAIQMEMKSRFQAAKNLMRSSHE